MKRAVFILVVLLCFIFNLGSVYAADRKYIGDQTPASLFPQSPAESTNLSVGTKDQTDLDQSLLPSLDKLSNTNSDSGPNYIWKTWPVSSYYFTTMPNNDASWVEGKMQDAASSVLDAAANMLFFLPKVSTLLGCEIITAMYSDTLARGMCGFVSEGAKAIGGHLEANTFSGLIFVFALVVLGVGIALYIFKGQLMKALTNVAIAIVCLVGFYLYVANVGAWIPDTLSFINDASGLALSASTTMKGAPVTDGNSSNAAQASGSGRAQTTLMDQGLADCTNAMWHILVGAPWAVGQLGSCDPNKLKLQPEQVKYYTGRNVAAHYQAGNNPAEALAEMGVISKILDGSYADTVWLAGDPKSETALLGALTQSKGKNITTVRASAQGQKSGIHHIYTALLTILPGILFLVFAIVLGIPVFLSQIMIMVMLFIMPLVLLMGVAGDSGMHVVLKFLKSLLGFLATKIIYGFYIGLTIMLAMVITHIDQMKDSPGTCSFLLACIFFFAIVYRKKFFNTVLSIISFSPDAEHHHGLAQWLETATATGAGFAAKSILWKRMNQHRNKPGKTPNSGSSGDSSDNKLLDREGAPERSFRQENAGPPVTPTDGNIKNNSREGKYDYKRARWVNQNSNPQPPATPSDSGASGSGPNNNKGYSQEEKPAPRDGQDSTSKIDRIQISEDARRKFRVGNDSETNTGSVRNNDQGHGRENEPSSGDSQDSPPEKQNNNGSHAASSVKRIPGVFQGSVRSNDEQPPERPPKQEPVEHHQNGQNE